MCIDLERKGTNCCSFTNEILAYFSLDKISYAESCSTVPTAKPLLFLMACLVKLKIK